MRPPTSPDSAFQGAGLRCMNVKDATLRAQEAVGFFLWQPHRNGTPVHKVPPPSGVAVAVGSSAVTGACGHHHGRFGRPVLSPHQEALPSR